jgi:gamma-butyrobetaine dioxygenase
MASLSLAKALSSVISFTPRLRFPAVWLRDHCPCSQCLDPSSGQKRHFLVGARDFAERVAAKEVKGFEVVWGDGHQSHFPQGWLEKIALSEGEIARKRGYSGHRLWGRADQLPQGHTAFSQLGSRAGLRAVLDGLAHHGIAMVKGVPVEPGMVARVAEMVTGTVRDSFYGRHWRVESKPNATNLAYTDLELPLHQDLLYFEAPPGVQLLHSHKNSIRTGGGETYFVDGWKVAEDLRASHPEHYETLKRVKVTYQYKVAGQSRVFHRPIITEQLDNHLHLSLAFSPPWMGPLECREQDIVPFYEALRTFALLAAEPERAFGGRLMPGDCVIFHNRRILHGRRPFSLSPGDERLLEGAYADLDDLHSMHRVAIESLD